MVPISLTLCHGLGIFIKWWASAVLQMVALSFVRSAFIYFLSVRIFIRFLLGKNRDWKRVVEAGRCGSFLKNPALLVK